MVRDGDARAQQGRDDNSTAVAREQYRMHSNEQERKRTGKLRRAWKKRRRGAMQVTVREMEGLTGRKEKVGLEILGFWVSSSIEDLRILGFLNLITVDVCHLKLHPFCWLE